MAVWDANWLALTDTRPGSGARAGSPELPGRGGASVGSVAEAIARELVSDAVEFAVDVAQGPHTAAAGELLTQVVALSEQRAEVGTVAAPRSSHHLDY